MSVKFEHQVVWGDCDPAEIVYYPRYFHWMDTAFQTLLAKAGMSQRTIHAKFNARTPIVDAGAKFISSVTFTENLTVDAKIVHWGTKSFRVSYQGSRQGTPIFEGDETRVWAVIDADGTMKASTIAPEFKTALTAVGS